MDASAVAQLTELTKALREQTFKLSSDLIVAKQTKKNPNEADLKNQMSTMERLVTQMRGLLPR